jgi:hypothetical protein
VRGVAGLLRGAHAVDPVLDHAVATRDRRAAVSMA